VPAAGTLEVLGTAGAAAQRALLALRKSIGVLLQGNGLLTDLNVFENVALPLRAHTDLPEPVLRELVLMKLATRSASARPRPLMPQELSGGMARRVALARALVLDPPLMLYDEPLTGLDPIACGVILDLIRRLNDSLGLTSIVITHHVHETLPYADRAVVVANRASPSTAPGGAHRDRRSAAAPVPRRPAGRARSASTTGAQAADAA
jgi:phospholipid/cholesterol/gamma-HCH transport system ATP-binding protein